MSLLDRLLPEPDFVLRDPEAVTAQLVSQYERLTGKTLYPAQVERILIDVVAYRESLMREAVQDAAKLNLVRYSRAPILDYLGENIGVARLPAQAAGTTLRFSFDPPPTTNTVLPAGTLVDVGDLSFTTVANITVPAGSTSIDVVANCTQPGTIGNGFVAGQIKTLNNPPVGLSVDSVQNITTSAGGADAEDDENLRERIVLAPDQFSNAGSVGAYRFFARSAHPDIIDVAVLSAQTEVQDGLLVSTNGIPMGQVNLYPLVKTGLPSSTVLAAVLATCNADDVRPLTDYVQALAPDAINFAITAQLTIYSTAAATLALAQATAAANAYRDRIQSKLGQDIVRTDIIDVLRVYGVYDVALAAPATNTVLTDKQWAHCTAINITIAGTANG